MSKRNDGGAAFPSTDYLDEKAIGSSLGMSMRDYFAGQALIAFSTLLTMITGANVSNVKMQNDGVIDEPFIAKQAYAIADAMLAERAK